MDTHIDPWADEWPACDLDGEQVFVDWTWDPARDMAVQVDCGEEVLPPSCGAGTFTACASCLPQSAVHAPRSCVWGVGPWPASSLGQSARQGLAIPELRAAACSPSSHCCICPASPEQLCLAAGLARAPPRALPARRGGHQPMRRQSAGPALRKVARPSPTSCMQPATSRRPALLLYAPRLASLRTVARARACAGSRLCTHACPAAQLSCHQHLPSHGCLLPGVFALSHGVYCTRDIHAHCKHWV